MTRKNLVIGAVGDDSVHPQWINDAEQRSFDLCLVYFGSHPERYAGQADYYFQRRELKLPLLHMAVQALDQVLPQYDRIWCPDDDIATDTATINRLFSLVEQHRLQIAQPSVRSGDVTFAALRQHGDYLLRYTRFVEAMCPVFTREALLKVLPTLVANRSGWGADWVWPKFFGRRQLAVLDAIGVDHVRPMNSGGLYQRLEAMGIDPYAEQTALLAKYKISNRQYRQALYHDTARLRALDADGRSVWTQPRFANLWPRRAA